MGEDCEDTGVAALGIVERKGVASISVREIDNGWIVRYSSRGHQKEVFKTNIEEVVSYISSRLTNIKQDA